MIANTSPDTPNESEIEDHYTIENPSTSRKEAGRKRVRRDRNGFDANILYNGVRERLRDPELEVRQHALRVLIDLIPVTQTLSLDDYMRALVPELLSNLGHPAPALRKGALDTLRIYLRNSRNYDQLLKEIISSDTFKNSVIVAAPFFINSNTTDETVRHVIDHLWNEAHNQNFQQEIVAKSLARMRYNLGDERFKTLIGNERFNELQKICDAYGLPIDYSDGDISDGDKVKWNEQESLEDRVILETEITLKTGPPITMKLHEESRPNSVNDFFGDIEDEARQKMGVIKVLEDDSESDFYEAARRTPRKVRFGGESVKMRTPESDSSNPDESRATIRITVTDAVSIKTRRSLIPVRITSLPATPRKSFPVVQNRLHKSTPNLSRNNIKSRIPLKREGKIHIAPSNNDTSENKEPSKEPSTPSEPKKPVPLSQDQPENKPTRGTEIYSPIPVHKEIEVFHNLTRSPERQRRISPSLQVENKDKQQEPDIPYNSFQVCPENGISKEQLETKLVELPKEIEEKRIVTMSLQQQHFQISSLSTEDEYWKSEALDNLVKMLKQPNTCETLEAGPAALLFEALFACQHLDKLHYLTDDALSLLVNGLRVHILEQCLGRLALGICCIGAPSGVSLALMIMKKCPARKLQLEIIERCFSHRTREGALQVLMAAARLLPSKDVEVNKITEFAAAALRDRRRRVRHAALETLATLAQLSSNFEILDVVNRVTENAQDHQHLLRVVRTRLSRRQLPTVEMDGTVRYSTPREQTEVEWLSGTTLPLSSPPSSSASSSTPSINYWRHNVRHEERYSAEITIHSRQDDSVNGNQQIWAADSTVFPKTSLPKDINKANGAVLRPVYILQPDAVRIGGRGHRKYDRGRSFSPPKPTRAPFQDVAGSAPHETNLDGRRRFKYNEGFQKSFSSEQLYYGEKPHHEPYSFSLSSRSSTTSTGSSTRSGIWQKDMRSGIPVPISSDTKLRLRINNTGNNVNTSVGPVIARRSALGSPVQSPITARSSPRENGNAMQMSIPPPHSSGSESSGYFTPPPETHQAFVKLDTEEHISESDEPITVNDDNNNSHDFVDSFNNNSLDRFPIENVLERNLSMSSIETSEHNEDREEFAKIRLMDSETVQNNNFEENEKKLHRFSSSSLKEPSFTGKVFTTPGSSPNRVKSKSEIDLQNFLPDISANNRKTVNSAPPYNDDITNKELVLKDIDEMPASVPKTAFLESIETPQEHNQVVQIPSENCTAKKLTRRFTRTLSKRSTKSTPRSVKETTPKSSRSSGKPKESLQQALAQLNSIEWETTVEGLHGLTRITRHNPDVVEAQIHTVCVNLGRHIKNLRSQVARVACNTASELFSTCKKGLDIELEEIAGPLLQRTADTNKFLRADANAALDVMCEQLPFHRVITVITARGCTHQNSIVRAASMRLINEMVRKLGGDRVFQIQKDIKDKILLAGANSLTDGSLEARSHAKMMFSCLIGHHNFHRALVDAVPQSTLRHIAKTLTLIKPHSVT